MRSSLQLLLASIVLPSIAGRHHHVRLAAAPSGNDLSSLEVSAKTFPKQQMCKVKSVQSDGLIRTQVCAVDSAVNVDEFGAACMFVYLGSPAFIQDCWIQQTVSLEQCAESCVIDRAKGPHFCCCNGPNCNDEHNIVYLN